MSRPIASKEDIVFCMAMAISKTTENTLLSHIAAANKAEACNGYFLLVFILSDICLLVLAATLKEGFLHVLTNQ